MRVPRHRSQRPLLEKILYYFRPLKYCEGRGCYVYTPGRSEDGRPYCLCCWEEMNPLKRREEDESL